jgi:hypothetical protein
MFGQALREAQGCLDIPMDGDSINPKNAAGIPAAFLFE